MAVRRQWTETFTRGGYTYRAAKVSIYKAGTTTPARVFTDLSGGTAIDSVPQVRTNYNGAVTLYFDPDDYPTGQTFDVRCVPRDADPDYSKMETIAYTDLQVFSSFQHLSDDLTFTESSQIYFYGCSDTQTGSIYLHNSGSAVISTAQLVLWSTDGDVVLYGSDIELSADVDLNLNAGSATDYINVQGRIIPTVDGTGWLGSTIKGFAQMVISNGTHNWGFAVDSSHRLGVYYDGTKVNYMNTDGTWNV